MTTACRFVPKPRMANLRTAAAASGSPPSPLLFLHPSPFRKTPPGPVQEGQAMQPWSPQVPPWLCGVEGSV